MKNYEELEFLFNLLQRVGAKNGRSKKYFAVSRAVLTNIKYIKYIKTSLSGSQKHLQMQSDLSDWCNTAEVKANTKILPLKSVLDCLCLPMSCPQAFQGLKRSLTEQT